MIGKKGIIIALLLLAVLTLGGYALSLRGRLDVADAVLAVRGETVVMQDSVIWTLIDINVRQLGMIAELRSRE